MRSGRVGRVAIAACFSVAPLVPRASVAQAPVTISGSAEVATAQLAREGTLSRSWTGAIMGARGGITFGRFTLEGQYAQGSLTPETGSSTGAGRSIVASGTSGFCVGSVVRVTRVRSGRAGRWRL